MTNAQPTIWRSTNSRQSEFGCVLMSPRPSDGERFNDLPSEEQEQDHCRRLCRPLGCPCLNPERYFQCVFVFCWSVLSWFLRPHSHRIATPVLSRSAVNCKVRRDGRPPKRWIGAPETLPTAEPLLGSRCRRRAPRSNKRMRATAQSSTVTVIECHRNRGGE